MEYEHPLYTPDLGRRPRRLPEIATDRLAFAGAYHGWGFHEDGARSGLAAAERLGLALGSTQPHTGRHLAAGDRIYADDDQPHPAHAVQAHLHPPLAHLAGRPRRPARPRRSLGRFEARDHLGDPDRTLRENVDAFLADHGVDLGRGGRVLMAAHAAGLRLLLQPDQRLLVLRRPTATQRAVVVEVHNTYGDRHAYLVHPDEQGRARTDKEMYVSPFHGTDGHYELAVPVPADRLDVASPCTPTTARRSAPALRGSPPTTCPCAGRARRAPRRRLIRAHGIWLWVRRLPVRPRPDHHQEGVSPDDPQPRPPAPPTAWPGLARRCPSVPAHRDRRRRRAPAVPRRRHPARRHRRVTLGPGRREVLGRGGPEMRIHRPDEFFARIGRDGLIGFGEAYLTGAWDADDLAGLPHRARRRDRPPWSRRGCSGSAAFVRRPAAPRRTGPTRPTAAPTSRTTTTCPTTCSGSSSTRP